MARVDFKRSPEMIQRDKSISIPEKCCAKKGNNIVIFWPLAFDCERDSCQCKTAIKMSCFSVLV